MTLFELSREYRAQAERLRVRMDLVQQQDGDEERLRVLQGMWREARDLAVLCERYYERGYRRNGKYTI